MDDFFTNCPSYNGFNNDAILSYFSKRIIEASNIKHDDGSNIYHAFFLITQILNSDLPDIHKLYPSSLRKIQDAITYLQENNKNDNAWKNLEQQFLSKLATIQTPKQSTNIHRKRLRSGKTY